MTDARHPGNPRLRLALFLALSTAMHAGLLLGGRGPAGEIEAGQDRDVLSVFLDGTAVAARAPPRPAEPARPVAHDTGPVAAAAVVPDLAAINDSDGDPNAANLVRAQVVSELARHFRYPPLARRRGWEGRVLLGFRVESDGQLHRQRVLRTSGFAVLDQAALDSLRRVARITDAGDTRQDVQISVLYRLTDTY